MLGDDSSSDDRMGELFAGKYRVRRRLGHGLTGSVYLGRSVWNDALMALKLLHPELARAPETLKRFLYVTGETSQLGHPNIVSIFESGQDPVHGVAYVAMEHVGGRNLNQLIADDGPLEEPRVVEILSQVLSALSLAHTRGLVHGDLKSNNILFRAQRAGASKAEQLVLCDFSVAQLSPFAGLIRARDSSEAALDTEAALLARAQYASPEQTQAEPLDARSDIYAVGVVLYRLLTGTLPFNADNARDLGLQQRLSVARPPSQLGCTNSALEAVCLKALSKTREARYQTAREMQSALVAALAPHGPARVPRATNPATGARLAVRAQPIVEARPVRPSIEAPPGPHVPQATEEATEEAIEARPVRHVIHARPVLGASAGRPRAGNHKDKSTRKAPRRTRVATLRIPRDQLRSHSLAPAERVSPVPSYKIPKRRSGTLLIATIVLGFAVWAGATRYSRFEAEKDSEADDETSSAAAVDTRQVATSPLPVEKPALAAAPVFVPTAQQQPVSESPEPAPLAKEPAKELSVNTHVDAVAPSAALTNTTRAPSAVPSVKPEIKTRERGTPDPTAAAHPSASSPAHGTSKPQPSAAVVAHADSVHDSEVFAAHARLSVGSIYTRAPVASADIRAAIDQDRVTDCYRAVLLVGTRLRSPLETRLDIETDDTGHITFAGVHLAQLPQDLRSCIEHVARTSRVSGSGAQHFAASITLAFDQH